MPGDARITRNAAKNANYEPTAMGESDGDSTVGMAGGSGSQEGQKKRKPRPNKSGRARERKRKARINVAQALGASEEDLQEGVSEGLAAKRRALMDSIQKDAPRIAEAVANTENMAQLGIVMQQAMERVYKDQNGQGKALLNHQTESEIRTDARLADQERQSRKGCLIFKSDRFWPKKGERLDQRALLKLVNECSGSKYGVTVPQGEVEAIHRLPSDKERKEGAIIIRFVTAFQGSAAYRLTNRQTLEAEWKGREVDFTLRVSQSTCNYDSELKYILDWVGDHSKYMAGELKKKGINPSKVIPYRRRIVFTRVDPTSLAIVTTYARNDYGAVKDDWKSGIASYKTIVQAKNIMTPEMVRALVRGATPDTWVEPLADEPLERGRRDEDMDKATKKMQNTNME